jgi:hypothetical protein
VLRDQFADAFDVYLELLRRVEKTVKACLGRDSPTWRILHGCPPCQYKVCGFSLSLESIYKPL